MASWEVFSQEAPDLARRGEERFDATGLSLVATLRRDGFPRISPVEPQIAEGNLYLGMMWQSHKALDLLRDPRVLIHSTVSDKDGREGEFKVYGRAQDVADRDERIRYCERLEIETGWKPDVDRFHLFRVEIEQVGWFQVVAEPEPGYDVWVWRPGAPPERRERAN